MRSAVEWCDDSNAPTMGIADKNWLEQQPYQIVLWLVNHGGSVDLNLGIIFVPDLETRTMFMLKWL
jgi:hypothetical protein